MFMSIPATSCSLMIIIIKIIQFSIYGYQNYTHTTCAALAARSGSLVPI